DAKGAHIGAKNTYDFYFNQHGRDSIDNAGMQLKSVVDYFSASVCPNAFWSSSLGMMVYCDTFAQADDVVAHELTHGITSRESRLFYYYQSGAINESFSDVWGEFIDQTSTTGIDDDSVGVKWLMGEDIGALRDMADPTTFSDPDKISSANYYEGDFDNGGVHTNSGVNNKAAYLMTDGGTFNTITVNALGIPKVAAVYYEVQTNLLTSGSDYRDLHDALYQACNNLIGTTPPGAGSAISVTDCDDGVFAAVEAVEMDTEPAVNFNPEAPVCDTGSALDLLYDSVENGVYNMDPNGVKVLTGVTNYAHWYPTNFNATSGLKSYYGDDFDYDGGSARSDTYMVMRGGVYLPAALPNAYLRFNHAYGFENTGVNYYDGGVLEYSINNGANWADANSLIDSGAYDYNGTISNSFDNPLKGRAAFVGDSHGFISSRLNLTPLLGKSVLFRWRMGTDFIGYDWGWWVDDIEFYSCYAVTPTVQMGFFRSQAANDGMILESAETTNAGGTLDSTKMYIGDDALDRQYKGLVSFDTSTLPDNAVIISATLRLKQSVPFIGQNVFNTHGYLVADVRRNMFGTSPSLQTMDFNVSPNLAVSGQFNPTASGGRWRSAYLSSSAPFISLGGVTQFRVYFTRDDNDDISADYIRFFTGEAGSKAPQLFVYYFIP
ncbi:MAG TPA: M4 family metallopeptidase, partial [Anaerolineales bacterium]|nr:M4 family metallopeptidase [Anaerolineales bacterium]